MATLFKGIYLLFIPNVPGATFIQGCTFIPDSRVSLLSPKPRGNYLWPVLQNQSLKINIEFETILHRAHSRKTIVVMIGFTDFRNAF